jgi:hypothetical protein
MYESSISFLRRAVIRQEITSQVDEKKEKKDKTRTKKESRMQARKAKDELHPAPPAPPRIRPTPTTRSAPLNSPPSRPETPTSQKDPTEPELAIKTGPRDSKLAKRQQLHADKILFDDSAATLRRILRADSVAIVDMDEYQLFIRRTSGDQNPPNRGPKKKRFDSKENLVSQFLQGKPWPVDVDPVVQYVPRSNESGVQVLGTDSDDPEDRHHFDTPGAENTVNEFLRTWLKTRHFWWDREDGDQLCQKIMGLVPDKSQTVLAMAFMTYDGRIRFATFVSWRQSPSTFGDSGTMALPFAWIVGGCTMAALAIKQVRNLEQSQISYSNLQAQ